MSFSTEKKMYYAVDIFSLFLNFPQMQIYIYNSLYVDLRLMLRICAIYEVWTDSV